MLAILYSLLQRAAHVYEVVGLPEGHFAKIARRNDVWETWQSHSGVRSSWNGRYGSVEAALDAVKLEVGKGQSEEPSPLS